MLGNWANTPGVPRVDVVVDAGDFYASKDFYDPVNKRRINWGWVSLKLEREKGDWQQPYPFPK